MNDEAELEDLISLMRASEIADYLSAHGWKRQEFPRPEIMCFRGSRDDRGRPITLVLPASERLADFGVRVEEVIRGLAVIEGCSREQIAREILSATSSVVAMEISATGLSLNSDARRVLGTLLASTQLAVEAARSGINRRALFECVGEVAAMLAQDANLAGGDETKKLAIWQICQGIMALADSQPSVQEPDETFWDAARNGNLADWLVAHFPQTPTILKTSRQQSGVSAERKTKD